MTTVVIEELGAEKIKERDVVDGTEVESESRCAESISHISAVDI